MEVQESKFQIQNLQSGAITLPIILIISGIIMELAVAGILISTSFNNVALNSKINTQSYAVAVAGAQDAIMRVIRYCPLARTLDGTACPTTYNLDVGGSTAAVQIKDEFYAGGSIPTGNKIVISSASIQDRNKRIEAYMTIDQTTGAVTVKSFKECYNDNTSLGCNFSGEVPVTAPPGVQPPSSPAAPSAPTSLAAQYGNQKITLTWVGSMGATAYKVYRSIGNNLSYVVLTSGGCSGLGLVSGCVDSGLTNGTVYYYKITAVGPGGESGFSNEVNESPIASIRFYLPSSGTASVNPTMVSGSPAANPWEQGTVSRVPLVTNKSNTAMTYNLQSVISTSLQFDVVSAQFVSAGLQAQTISGYVKGQMLTMQGIFQCVCNTAVVIKVVSNDGATLKGTLLSYFPPNYIPGSTYPPFNAPINRRLPPQQDLSPVTVSAGDRLVIEIGSRSFATGDLQSEMRMGDSQVNDLPEDEADTSTNRNPWIEFSRNILFQ